MSFLSPMFAKLRSLMTKAASLPVATAQPGSTAGQASPTVPPKKPKMTRTIMTQAQLIKTFGDPGDGPDEADPKWRKANCLTCRNEKGNRPSMPGVPTHFYFEVHKLMEPSMREAFAAAQKAAPDYVIHTAGCLVYRHKQRNPKKGLSEHAFACAVDINSADNKGVTFDIGKEPEPWSEAWWKIWPKGLPQAFVEEFESRGYCWGGRWRGFVDPMHMCPSQEMFGLK